MGTLDGKNAIIYGGAGSIGAATAHVFAREGAHVQLVGRSQGSLEQVARTIGNDVDIAVLDAGDESEVDDHVRDVAHRHGSVDISFNLTTRGDAQGTPLVNMTVADLMRAVDVGLKSNFVTARAAARQMAAQGSGVLLHLNSGSGAGAAPGMGSTGPADAAIESMYRYFAAELGASGVRVCGIWTAGVAETLTDEKIAQVAPNGPTAEQALQGLASMSVLNRNVHLADVSETAAFLASDRAAGITGTMTNVTAGLVLR